MSVKCPPCMLAVLADRLGQTWCKLEVQIGWYQIDPADEGTVGPEVKLADRARFVRMLAECVEQPGGSRRFVDESGATGVAAPIRLQGRSIGCVYCLMPSGFSEHSEALLDMFADQAEQLQTSHTSEIELASLSEHLAQSYEELSLVYKLSHQLKLTEEPRAYFERFADELVEIIHARTLVMLVRSSGDPTELIFTAGEARIARPRLEAACRYMGQLAHRLTEPTIMTDLSAHPTLVNLIGHVDHNVLLVPLRTSTRTIGVIAAIDKTLGDEFDSTDAKLANSIAEQTSNFLQNRFLVHDLQELLIGLLTSLVNAIDAKDPYTSGHSQRVALIAQRIAESMRLPAHEVTEVYLAGLLHDIGKIGVDDEVLTRPGKLTREEFAAVQEHPVIGARIISGIKQLQNILPGVLYHHERYDGSGYPEGLTGEQIPMMGAIVALGDCFDAITSDRTYHRAMDYDRAMAEIKDLAGTSFSPIVVQALVQSGLDRLKVDLQEVSESKECVSLLPSLLCFNH